MLTLDFSHPVWKSLSSFNPSFSILPISCLNLCVPHLSHACNCPSLPLSISSMIPLTISPLPAYISLLFPLPIPPLYHSLQYSSPSLFLSLRLCLSRSIHPFHLLLPHSKAFPPVLCLKLSFIRGATSTPPF